MPKTSSPAATVSASADDIEAAFYAALQIGDIESLMACWSDDDEVCCVHPGGPRLVGQIAIRAAFEQMFAHGAIHATPTRVRKVESMVSAVHNVLERIEVLTTEGPRHAFVLSTNVYHKTPHGWRLVAHHASPGSAHAPDEADEIPQTLH